MFGLLMICLSAQFAEAKIIRCSYVSKVDGVSADQIAVDEVAIDTNVRKARVDEPLLAKEVVGGLLKVFGDDAGIAISLSPSESETINASSNDVAGKMTGSVHLNHVKKGILGETFTSVKCEFAQ